MSMVTLYNIVANYNLPEELEVKICRADNGDTVIDMYPFLKECSLKRLLTEHLGEVMTIKELKEKFPEVCGDFEWTISDDHKSITHFEFGLIESKESHKLCTGKYLILEIQNSHCLNRILRKNYFGSKIELISVTGVSKSIYRVTNLTTGVIMHTPFNAEIYKLARFLYIDEAISTTYQE